MEFIRAFLGFEREFINVHVAWRDIAPGGRDADDGLLEIFVRECDIASVRLSWRANFAWM
jgi:hypothetical protein